MKNIRKQAETSSLFTLTDTCVQLDRHKSLSRQTQASVTTNTCVCPSPSSLTRRCQCCGREFPLGEFYFKNHLHALDNYCKQCRREANRLRRKAGARSMATGQDAEPRYPVITRTEDPETRRVLLLHALQVVRDSVLRRRKQRNADS